MFKFLQKKEPDSVLYKPCMYTGGRIYGEKFNSKNKGNNIAVLIVSHHWKVASIKDA